MSKSRYACELSILSLFVPDLWNVDPKCYLHTLTFADPEPSVSEAMRRFNSFAVWLRRHKKRCVRVVERGEETGRVHYHLISSQRWDAAEMWRVLPRYGFGRYDVRERPFDRAFYAVKYVSKKSKFALPRGTRKWGCVGFEGTKVLDVVMERKELQLVADVPRSLADKLVWLLPDDNWSLTINLREPLPPDPIPRMNELKQVQIKEIIENLLRGDVGGVAEYRSSSVRTFNTSDPKNPTVSVKRVVVEHNVEFGGNPLTISEWMPVGADEHSIKPAASRGEVVFVRVESLRWDKGTKKCSGTIHPLSTLPLVKP